LKIVGDIAKKAHSTATNASSSLVADSLSHQSFDATMSGNSLHGPGVADFM